MPRNREEADLFFCSVTPLQNVRNENFGDWKKSTEYLRTSSAFAANPMGAYVDPDAMIAARAAGASVEEVHRRGYAGEFPPSKPMDPRVLL